jgi:hypothetical protein
LLNRPPLTGKVVTKASVLLVLVAIITLGGGIGATLMGQEDPFWWSWLHVLDTGTLADDGISMARRILGTLLSLAGLVIVGGLVIAFIEDGAKRQLERLFRGSVPNNLHAHTVIFGSGQRAGSLVNAIASTQTDSKDAMLIVAVRDPAHIVETRAACGESAQVIVASLIKDADRTKLQLGLSDRIVILNEATTEAGDALVALLSVAGERAKHLEDKRNAAVSAFKPIQVHFELAHLELADGLAQVFDGLRTSIDVQLIAIASASARLALKEYPLDCATFTENARVQLIISGWSPLAEAFIWHTLARAHFGTRRPTGIFVVSEDFASIEQRLRALVPELDKIVDFKAVAFIPDIRGWGMEREDVVTLLACGASADDAVSRALKLRESSLPGLRQILVETPEESGYQNVLSHTATSHPTIALHAIGSTARLVDLGNDLDLTARRLHERYREQRLAQGKARKDPDSGRYLDPADEPWERLDSVRRAWNRASADHADVKLRALARMRQIDMPRLDAKGHQLSAESDLGQAFQQLAKETKRIGKALRQQTEVGDIDPILETLACMEHDRWMAERRSEGWVFGPEKDVEWKVSPYLVPYESLEPEVKHYDREAVVESLRYYFTISEME